MWMITTFFSKVLSVLFPSQCYSCHKEDENLCVTCLRSCKRPLDTPALYITSAFCFKDLLIKKAIHAIKYFHKKDLVEPLTRELAIELRKNLENQPWVLIPIPMPGIRKLVRGYNQAELIAGELSKQCNFTIDRNILIRIQSPKRQVKTKTRGERLRNQHNSFKVITDVRGMHIILIDDVTTTGATLAEARYVLMQAGAHTVRAATLAH